MITFLAEVGKKLADRFAAAVLVPGLLLLAAIVLAGRLGQAHAIDVTQVRLWIGSVAASPSAHSNGTLLLIIVGVLAGSTAAGLAAAAIGAAVGRAWLLAGYWWPARLATAWRRNRWHAADAAARRAIELAARAVVLASAAGVTPPDVASAIARRDAICLVEPDRPTWVADRLRAADLRVYRTYDLDLTSAWPSLWTIAPDPLRADLSAAQSAYSAAGRLAGWGLLYLVIAARWWPAVLIAVISLATARTKARASGGTLAELAETTVDLYGAALAAQLGIPCDGALTADAGLAITQRLRKDHVVHTQLTRRY